MGKTSYKDLVFARNEFLRLVRAPNQSLIHIIKYFDKTSYKDLVFAQNDFLRLVRAPNESLILLIIYYMFKYLVGIKITLLESLQSQKNILKAIFQQNKL